MDSMYHEGHRELQDRYGGRRVADRMEEHIKHAEFTEEEQALIESAPFFFLATAHGGAVDCSFKGGMPGFVRVVAPNELAWPDYDGNRMYRSLGNIHGNPKVGLLFIKFDAQSRRLRINGTARIDEDPSAIEGLPGAKRLVRLKADSIYPNCPRYIPEMEFVKASVYNPRKNYNPPDPEWKQKPFVADLMEE